MSGEGRGRRGPRRKRMCRARRLQSARRWLANYRGKDLVRGYATWYGVDPFCAALELQMLGVELAPGRMEALRAAARSRSARPSSERTRERTLRDEGYGTPRHSRARGTAPRRWSMRKSARRSASRRRGDVRRATSASVRDGTGGKNRRATSRVPF
ncbi:MAG TPA: hypothetical protein VGQ78_07775, partial [Vicinamibacteria bacterium]|nr:hypothetical protein [Vicinamibacteria bacterium]